MKDDIIYEPLGEGNYQRIINFLESEISRLKGELLPAAPASSTERDRQRTVPPTGSLPGLVILLPARHCCFHPLQSSTAISFAFIRRSTIGRSTGTVPKGVCQSSAELAASPVKADKVRRAEQDNAHYALPRRGEPAIAGRSNRSGIDVTGMRRDQRLRYGSNRGGHGAAEEVIDLASELGGVRRVERSGDRGGTDSGQGWAPNRMLPRL